MMLLFFVCVGLTLWLGGLSAAAYNIGDGDLSVKLLQGACVCGIVSYFMFGVL